MLVVLVLVVVMLGTADKLKIARKIAVNGAVNGSTNFDGSGNVTIPVTASVSKVTKTLSDSGITVNVILRKQLNIVYANFNIVVPKNTTNTISLSSVFPSGYIPNENIEITISENNTGTQHVKLYLRTTGGILGTVHNASTSESLTVYAQSTYIID